VHREVPVALDKKYYLLTGKNGVLDTTTTGDIDDTFCQLGTQSNIIFYCHGGLVKKDAGLDGAARLLPRFLSISAYPVFFVYESGFLEILSHNLTDIAAEDVFKALLRRLLKYTVSKLRDPLGAKGLTSVPPTDIELHEELRRRDDGDEPFRQEPIDRAVSPVTESEERDLREELKKDNDLMQSLVAIATDPQQTATTTFNTRGLGTRTRKSAR